MLQFERGDNMIKKKKAIKITIILAILLLSFSILLALLYNLGYTPQALMARAFGGDRITVNIHATIDGEPVFATFDDISNLSDEADIAECANSISNIKNKEDFSILKCHAKSYGPENFYVLLDDEYSIVLNMWQFNWWNIQESELYIDIDTKKGTITYYDNYTSLLESGVKYKESSDKQTEPYSNRINIWIGER